MQEEQYFLTQTTLTSEEGESYIAFGIRTEKSSAAVEDISTRKDQVQAMVSFFNFRHLPPQRLTEAVEQMLALEILFDQ